MLSAYRQVQAGGGGEVKGISWRSQLAGILSRDVGGRCGFAWVAGAVALVTAAKLFVSWCAIGTNDAVYWMDFAEVIQKAGSVRIYALLGHYNHPPLISWLLAGLNVVEARTGWPFPFLIRLLPILADAASVFVIWHLLQRRRPSYALALTLICCFNPVSFLISAYHGNTDPVFIFLVLLAVLLAGSRRTFWAGLTLGLSLCVKIVPVMFVPVFWFWLQDRRERAVFSGAALVFPLIVFAPALILSPGPFFHNVFQYSGLKGIWGIGHLFLEAFAATGLLQRAPHVAANVLVWLVWVTLSLFTLATILFSWRVVGRRRVDLVEGLFFVTALFLILTPGFGVQYLSWLAYFAVLSAPVLGTAWVFLAGTFLLRVYAFWGGLAPPYYANSYLAGQWRGFDRLLDLTLWALLFILLSFFSRRRRLLQAAVRPRAHP